MSTTKPEQHSGTGPQLSMLFSESFSISIPLQEEKKKVKSNCLFTVLAKMYPACLENKM